MNFLRALFWIVLTFVVVVCSLHNWTNVTVQLFGGLAADVKLPLLVLGSFLLGFVPLYVWHRAWRWRTERRIAAAERAFALPVVSPAVAPPAVDPIEPPTAF